MGNGFADEADDDRRAVALKALWTASLAPGLLLFGTILVAYAYWGRVEQPSLSTMQADATAISVASAAFGLWCVRANRWLALPVAAWGCVALGLTHLANLHRPLRLDPVTAEVRAEAAQQRLADLDHHERAVESWRAGRAPAEWMPCGISGHDPHFVAGLPFYVPVRGSGYGIVHYDGPIGSTESAWSSFGEGFADVLPTRREEAEARLAAHRAGLANPPARSNDEAWSWALASFELTAVLFAFNAAALMVSGLFRRFARRRPIPAVRAA